MKQIDPRGMSVAQLALEAINRGVYVLIGCHNDNVGRVPKVISVQVQDASGEREPLAFSFQLVPGDPYCNAKLCALIWEHIEKVKPSPLKLISARYKG